MIIRKANLFKCVFFMDDDVSYSNYINVKKIISKYWKPKEWRFIEEKAIDWIPPSDRFPLSVKNIKEI